MTALIEAEVALAAVALSKGADPRETAVALLDAWGAPRIAKADRDDPSRAGAHGHPEIGRVERQFYENLTAGRKQAYRDLVRMVDLLHRRRKPFRDIDPWRAVDEPLDEWRRRALHAMMDDPMKAFALGQVLAAEYLARAAKRKPITPEDRTAVEYLKAYTFNEVHKKFEQMKGSLRAALIQGVQERANPREVARRLAAELEDYDTDLNLIAITETARAESQGRLLQYAEEGEEFVVGSSAHDARTCEHCKRLIDGKVRRIKDTTGRSNYGRRAKDYLAVIPLHPRCRCVWLPWVGPRTEALRLIEEQRKTDAA